MRRPAYVRCLYDPGCPTLDTATGSEVPAREIGTVLIDAHAADVRAALGFGACYMERALACARISSAVLSTLFPRLESERQCPNCRTSSQGINLARWGAKIDPEVAAELVASRATARAVEAAGLRAYEGHPDLQRRAARAALMGVRRKVGA